jgi:hypothetical protein
MGTVYESGHSVKLNNSDNIINFNYMNYRGNDLGEVSISTIDTFISSHNIQEGYFTDLYVGDYFTATYDGSTITFRIMDIDPYYNIEESDICYTHHVLIVPDILCLSKMEIKSVSNINYKTSYINTNIIPIINTNLESIFGDHLLLYNETVPIDCNGSIATISVNSILMSEIEIFGRKANSSNKHGLLQYQLPGFKQNSNLQIGYYKKDITTYWDIDFSSTASNIYYRYVYTNISTSIANCGEAYVGNITNDTYTYGVRPRFLLG